MSKTEPTAGVTLLRKVVHARNRSPHAIALFAREVEGVSASTLEDFAAGRADLDIAALQALTKALFPHAEFDAASGLLRPANRAEPRPICAARPEPFDPHALPYYVSVTPGVHLPPQPVKPAEPKQTKRREGWLGGLL